MNQDERRIITEYVERVSGAAPPAPASGGAASGGPWGGSGVPAVQARPNLPPVDREADALITELFTKHPEARYRITQTAFVQEAALVEAQNRIRRLEWEVENAQRQTQQAQTQRGGGGLFGGMFGGGQQQQRQAGADAAAAAAGLSAGLQSRDAPAGARRLGLPRHGADHRGWCRGRHGARQHADERLLRRPRRGPRRDAGRRYGCRRGRRVRAGRGAGRLALDRSRRGRGIAGLGQRWRRQGRLGRRAGQVRW